jgi:hypothetical protein
VLARINTMRMDSEDVRASGDIMSTDVGSPDALCDRVIVPERSIHWRISGDMASSRAAL